VGFRFAPGSGGLPAAPQSVGQNDVQQDSQRNAGAQPPCDSVQREFSKTVKYAVGHRARRTEDSRAQSCEGDQQDQLQGTRKLIHQVKGRRV
jgi:hypothetical protein